MSEWDGFDRLIHVRLQAADQNVNGRVEQDFSSECQETNLWPPEGSQRGRSLRGRSLYRTRQEGDRRATSSSDVTYYIMSQSTQSPVHNPHTWLSTSPPDRI